MKRRTKVYIAGPYSQGQVALNVKNAIDACEKLWKLGYLPFCPHLNHLWEILYPPDVEYILAFDMAWLEICDCMLRLDGFSPGAEREEQKMVELDRPVFKHIETLVDTMPVWAEE